jgi:hypothetical protein
MKAIGLIGALALLAIDPALPAKKNEPPKPDPVAAEKQVKEILQLEGGSFKRSEYQSIMESIASPLIYTKDCSLVFTVSHTVTDKSADTSTESSWDDMVVIPLSVASLSNGPALIDSGARAIELSTPTAAIKITHGNQLGPKAPSTTLETAQSWEFVFARSDQDTIQQVEQLTASLTILQNSCKPKETKK